MSNKPRKEGEVLSPIRMYLLHVQALVGNGAKTIAYSCPACNHELITQAAGKSEVWDSISTCPYCGKVYLKVTNHDRVSVRLP